MKTDNARKSRSHAEIIAELANLPSVMQGSISTMTKQLANGKTATYHNLQYWADGKNHTIHIPKEKLGEFRAAVENGRKSRALLAELTEADAQSVLSASNTLKKNSRKSRCAPPSK